MRRLAISLASAHGSMAVSAAQTAFTPAAIDGESGVKDARSRGGCRIAGGRLGTPPPDTGGIAGGWSSGGSSSGVAGVRRPEQLQGPGTRDGGSVSTVAGLRGVARVVGGRSASRPQPGVTGRGATAWTPGRPDVPGPAACLHVSHPLRDAMRAKLAGGPAARTSATSPADSLTSVESPARGCVAGNRIGAASPAPRGWFGRARRSGGTLNSIAASRKPLLRPNRALPAN